MMMTMTDNDINDHNNDDDDNDNNNNHTMSLLCHRIDTLVFNVVKHGVARIYIIYCKIFSRLYIYIFINICACLNV